SIPENYIHSNPSYVHEKKIWNLRIFEREKIREPVLLIDDRQRIDHKDPHSTCMLFLRLCMPVGIDHGAKKNMVDRITHSLEISTVPLRKSRRRPTPFGIWTWEPPLVGTNCSCTSKSGSPRKDRHCYCSAISI